MLKNYHGIAQEVFELTGNSPSWPEITFDQDAKRLLRTLPIVQDVKDHTIVLRTKNSKANSQGNICLAPSQYVLYALQAKEFAFCLKDHLEFFYSSFLKNYKSTNDAKKALEQGLYNLSEYGLDEWSASLALRVVKDKDFRFEGKYAFNGDGTKRQQDDVLGSILLKKLNVPDASSAVLGRFICTLVDAPEVYHDLDCRYGHLLPQITSAKEIRWFALRVYEYLMRFDGCAKFDSLMASNGQSGLFSFESSTSKLTSILRLSEKFLTRNELKTSGTLRFFEEPVRYEEGRGYWYFSTQWTDDGKGSLDFGAFKAIVEECYPEFTVDKQRDKYVLARKRGHTLRGVSSDAPQLHSAFQEAIVNCGSSYDPYLTRRFASSLLAKRFVILAGLSGSGKTLLASAFARWLVDSENCYAMIPVGADWTNREPLLGYTNALDSAAFTFPESGVLQLILDAEKNLDKPYFLILDEMNMSHVERYFAEFLSAIESRERIRLHSSDEPLSGVPRMVSLPTNLYVVGTVNVDETTYMFSPKVLDRANVIEFRMNAAELDRFLSNPASPDLSKLDCMGASFGKSFVEAGSNQVEVPADVKSAFDAEMLLFFKTLEGHGAEFGYRTAYETARFIHFYKLLGNHPDGDTTWFPAAFDCVVCQKLLPKLHGSRARLGPILKKLWFLSVNNEAGRGADALKAAEEAVRSTEMKAEPSVVVPPGAPYPLSAEKIGRMWRLLIENGFASFAEA